ncbi:MAG: DEAD/DEAH box helicase [Gammaproteobacteria bacterium]|nr:DEAD/DEAH box helicase [Gammaproteobacteria bacterium]MBU1490471.1 DEAD/DEAH box helicase [Gammaproteobacteria bacterium]MBU2140286.1 DEAD/DEAH box helicase [Gammaproteobacteria bacterium]MBU2217159.1 DEAD/DEAH box helicase [Gammaproteobacteria bacterium]MBU2323883.1 DEAD/DEAH box helicase [Gammaproteobacteria bacterium]
MFAKLAQCRQRLRGVLMRYFPRTAAYLSEAGLRHPQGAASAKPTQEKAPRSRTKANNGAAGAQPPGKKARTPSALPRISDTQRTAMRERVAAAVAAGVVSSPSDEQWAMILAPDPLTRIFAGAGSGKSTTLVLRVVFMLCHLGIEPGRLTVISFTNASCAQLREQLRKVLAHWQYPFDTSQARQCVRTFHAAMAQQARMLLPAARWFEQLGAPGKGDDEPDTPLGARLRTPQQHLLRQVYAQCYAEQPAFRTLVHELLNLPPLDTAADRPVPSAPMASYTLAGEFSAAPLYEVFHAQADFIESIGLRLDRLNAQTVPAAPRERVFIQALVLFRQTFDSCLQAQGLMTFNSAFQRLTERLAAGEVPAEAVAPLEHLLIDEFQDISPQIVQWLQTVRQALAQGKRGSSLMAIGDDWQSIYGWRGSSPELFVDFDRHFPTPGKRRPSACLMLTTNYRSIEPIIRDGERVLRAVRQMQAKTCQAFRPTGKGEHGVRVISGFDLNSQLPQLLTHLQTLCAEVSARPDADRTPVLLLSRRNENLRRVQAALDKRLPVKACSIHRAKGLQAEVAVIIDDSQAIPPHPLRNALYTHSGFFRISYDEAMQDESLRLAYVAITRGVSRVFWYTRTLQGAPKVLAQP